MRTLGWNRLNWTDMEIVTPQHTLSKIATRQYKKNVYHVRVILLDIQTYKQYTYMYIHAYIHQVSYFLSEQSIIHTREESRMEVYQRGAQEKEFRLQGRNVPPTTKTRCADTCDHHNETENGREQRKSKSMKKTTQTWYKLFKRKVSSRPPKNFFFPFQNSQGPKCR